jgi:alpha-1,3-fucosyltransferase 10
MAPSEDPLVVLFLNGMWGAYPVVDASAAGVPCVFSTDVEDLARADVVVVHLPTAPPLDTLEKRPGQTWVAWSMESDVTVPLIADRQAMAIFDLEASYRRSADFWCPYLEPASLDHLLSPPQPKTEPYPVAHFQSNPYDRSGRTWWLAGLMRRVKIASYGTFLPTMPGAGTIRTREQRLAVCARHKFTLAFENSISDDYVSNKLFEVWETGSVPVYLGARNVAQFAPSRRSYIDVTDFEGPVELARYLNHLAGNPDDYEEYLAWKLTGPDDAFLELMASVDANVFARIAERVHADRSLGGSSARPGNPRR